MILAGAALVILGLWLAGKLPFLGRLPGDIRIHREGFTFAFPVTTCLLLSLLLSALLSLLRRW